ncbi:juvenile hormone esterase-like isoform X2 [Tribolium madens]|uniref:juvenile hormone esterase-like isoform X2 n=1 Tax=Tribolium madens TaxID=41895 RepID=UPI001CF74BAB|nr:juvenile hormone esterase-like isoform X2 [Tribolium madens]
MTRFLKPLLVLVTIFGKMSVCENPVVVTTSGRVQGRIWPNSSFYAFQGIPYAKPPLGKLRFQAPEPPEPWNGTKICHEYGPKCLQTAKTGGSITGNEDCLTLNVFTQNLENPKPVLVYFHGGAHLRGSGADLGPEYLMEKPVVLVTVNFRLNVFGFLSTNDENAWGNAGIKDQVRALEWVRGNIGGFGGDGAKVTIFGESSGADSVGLIQLSPRGRGLFQGVIMQSGSSLNSRYLQRNPLNFVMNLANFFGINCDNTKNMVEGLRNIEGEELVKASNSTKATGHETDLRASAFYPVIEAENKDAIITQSPFELLKSGNFNKVPFIVGYNSNEGTLGLNIVKNFMKIDDFDSNYELFYPQSLNNVDKSEEIGSKVREYFLGDDTAKNTEKFSKFLGQDLLVRGIRKSLDFFTKHSEGYFYKFVYQGTHTGPHPGVGHAEELQYIFTKNGTTENLTENDVLTRRRMVEMWTNFATHGDSWVRQFRGKSATRRLRFLKLGKI